MDTMYLDMFKQPKQVSFQDMVYRVLSVSYEIRAERYHNLY